MTKNTCGQGPRSREGHQTFDNRSDMVLKVKEPLPAEYDMLREGQVLFTYLHLAASESLTLSLLRKEVVAIAYETVETDDRLSAPSIGL